MTYKSNISYCMNYAATPPNVAPPQPVYTLADFLESGLFKATIAGSQGANFSAYRNTPINTQITSTINISNEPTYRSEAMIGYFKPPTTGTMTFTLFGDDYAFLWLGDGADDPSISNLLVKSDSLITRTATKQVDSITYYPFRLYYGNSTATGRLTLTMSGPGISNTSNFTNTLFHDTRINSI